MTSHSGNQGRRRQSIDPFIRDLWMDDEANSTDRRNVVSRKRIATGKFFLTTAVSENDGKNV